METPVHPKRCWTPTVMLASMFEFYEGTIWERNAINYVAYTCGVLLRTPHVMFYILLSGLICKLWRAESWKGTLK